jgi:hypothetical protein
MMECSCASEAPEVIANGVAVALELSPDGIWGQNSGRHGGSPVAFDLKVTHCSARMDAKITYSLGCMWVVCGVFSATHSFTLESMRS